MGPLPAGKNPSNGGVAAAPGNSNGEAAAKGDVEEGGQGGESASALPFKPLSMAFRDVRYSVPLPQVRDACWARCAVLQSRQSCVQLRCRGRGCRGCVVALAQ